ncbi:MAG: TolC family protein [Planctomycetaceae bacterium]|nr:TolC family protein [Planctomycetaceae bacterium]
MNHFRYYTKIAISALLIGVCFQFGCHPQQSGYFGAKGRWQHHYLDRATQIDYPNVDLGSIPEVSNTYAPLTLENPDPEAMWDLTLEEALHMAMKNSKVIRTLTGVGFSQAGVNGVPGMLLQNPNGIRTVYDPALMESDPRAGQEAALSAFDAQLNAGARWTKSDTPGRSINGQSRSFQSDVGTFNLGISKFAATGTQFWLNHVNQYSDPETSGVQFSAWSNYLEGGFRHHLLRGGGVEYNRIAGPNNPIGTYGGVAVARINTDMSLNDFEMATRNLVADVEKAYWNLYYAYHRLDSVRSGRDAALQTWRQTNAYNKVGDRRGRAQNLAQAEQNYFTFRSQTEIAQDNLFKAEAALRYILGLASTDGRLIRPIDDPITAPLMLDWQSVYCEALFRSPELRKQKWEIKRRELELCASRNYMLPSLDLEAGYRVSGAGKDLTGSDSAYNSLVGGNYTGWTVGLTASAPFGWRREQAAVRNAELQLTRARAILHEQELELRYQLDDSFRTISLAYQQMQTTLAAFRAASEEVRAVKEAYEFDTATLDLLLQAQQRRANAETGYYSSVIDYNLAIMTLHYRKGSLLEYNNVCLVEGPWPAKAYFDAQRRARERDAGHYFNYGYRMPGVVSRGTYAQHQNGFNSMAYEELPMVQPSEESNYPMPMPPPPQPGTMRTIETDATFSIPTPVLPRPSENTPVSYTAPAPAPTSTLTPARHYVR